MRSGCIFIGLLRKEEKMEEKRGEREKKLDGSLKRSRGNDASRCIKERCDSCEQACVQGTVHGRAEQMRASVDFEAADDIFHVGKFEGVEPFGLDSGTASSFGFLSLYSSLKLRADPLPISRADQFVYSRRFRPPPPPGVGTNELKDS